MRFDLASDQIPTAWYNALPGCPSRCSRRCTRRPGSRSVPTTWRRCSRWRSSTGDDARSRGSTSPARCSTSFGCGGRRRSCAPSASSRSSAPRRASTSRTSRFSPAGSHKPNTAVAQAFYNKAEGIKRLATETGAGQWGIVDGLRVRPVRPRVQGVHGADVVRAEAVPANPDGDLGRRVRAVTHRRPVQPGSLGMAISDAVRDAASRADSHYALGSVLNHVMLHQTVIGLEARNSSRWPAKTCPTSCSRPAAVARTWRHRASRSCRTRRAPGRGRADFVPDAHRGHLQVRLRRHRRASPR